MSFTTWTPRALLSEARPCATSAWQVVEAQRVASTMKIVDSGSEHDILEALIARSQAPGSRALLELDDWLAAPFRLPPLEGGSRFRGPTDPGVFYGASGVHTACAELGHRRWRFLMDAVDLERIEPVSHTAFQTVIAGAMVDLRDASFEAGAPDRAGSADRGASQALARAAREADLDGIVYRSAYDPEPNWCVALLTPRAFARKAPDPLAQTWWLAVRRAGVVWRREHESFIFSAADWPIERA